MGIRHLSKPKKEHRRSKRDLTRLKRLKKEKEVKVPSCPFKPTNSLPPKQSLLLLVRMDTSLELHSMVQQTRVRRMKVFEDGSTHIYVE